jgi:5-methylcytosine-specific restriction endonuclease McrA
MSINAEMRGRVYAKYGGRCAYCGVEMIRPDMHVDHIHPVFSRGQDDFENLNPSCRRCNNFKATHSLEQFRHELSKQIERCRAYSVNFRNAERFGLVKVLGTEIVFYFERPVVNGGAKHG